jgi:hypothetical protein
MGVFETFLVHVCLNLCGVTAWAEQRSSAVTGNQQSARPGPHRGARFLQLSMSPMMQEVEEHSKKTALGGSQSSAAPSPVPANIHLS